MIIAVEYPCLVHQGKGIHSVFGDLADIVNFGDVSGIIDIEIQSVTFFIGFVDQLRHIFPFDRRRGVKGCFRDTVDDACLIQLGDNVISPMSLGNILERQFLAVLRGDRGDIGVQHPIQHGGEFRSGDGVIRAVGAVFITVDDAVGIHFHDGVFAPVVVNIGEGQFFSGGKSSQRERQYQTDHQ